MFTQSAHTRLTHEVLSTLMAEVMAIMNVRPLVLLSTDPDMPAVLTPAMILTQKTSALSAPSGNFDPAELHTKQWKHVQCLADTFWKRNTLPLFRVKENGHRTSPTSKLEVLFCSSMTKLTGIIGLWDWL